MGNYHRKIIMNVILLIIIIIHSIQIDAKQSVYVNEMFTYVALGDSVPAGYGLPSPLENSYPKLFSEMLKNDNNNVIDINLAESGITTEELLNKLMNFSDDELSLLKTADLLTLNIGGNNLLQPLLSSIRINEAATPSQKVRMALRVLLLSPDEILIDALQKGMVAFERDFIKILDFLHTATPNATLIISTVYNPIPPEIKIYQIANEMITNLNTFIINSQEEYNYFIADIFAAFSEAEANGVSVTNMNLRGPAYSIDIHPTIEGHRIIAQVHKNVYKSHI